MRAVRIKSRDTAFCLAFEEYLAGLETDEDFFAVWRDSPAVVCGRFQNVFRETDVLLAEERGVGVFRRITGGGAVYHEGGNVNFTLITNRSAGGIDPSRLLDPLADALRSLGLDARATEGTDIAVDGVKVSGSARAAIGGRELHHATLLFDADLDALHALTSGVDGSAFVKGGIPSRPAPVKCIAPLLPDVSGAEEFSDVILKSVCGGIKPLLEDDFDRDAVLEKREKYLSREWTFGANPRFEFSASAQTPDGDLSLYYVSKSGKIGSVVAEGTFADEIGKLVGLDLYPGSVRRALLSAGAEKDAAEALERLVLTGRTEYI